MMYVHDDRSVIITPGTYVQHFTRELCTLDEYMNQKYVYKIIGTQMDDINDRLMIRLERKFGDFHEFVLPIDDFLMEVDKKKYPTIKQKYVYEEIDYNGPKYPLHPNDYIQNPIERFEEGKYKSGDIIDIPLLNENSYDKYGIDFHLRIDDYTRKEMEKEFIRKIDRGVAFITLEPNWNKLFLRGEIIAKRVLKDSKINVNEIIGNVLSITDTSISVKILHPGPFNRLHKNGEELRVVRRVSAGSGVMSSDRVNSIELVCYDLELPSEYIINL